MDYINPLMQQKVHLYLCLIFCFWKQVLQGAKTDLFNTLVPKAHNSECQNLLIPLKINPVKASNG